MKLTVIGYWGAYPGKNEASSGYLLQEGGYNVLLDCGSGVLSLLPNYLDVNDLDAVVVSHYHPDHVADAGVILHTVIVQKAMGERTKPLLFCGHPEDALFKSMYMEDHTEIIPAEEGRSLELGPFVFSFKKASHPVEAYSMRISCGGKSVGYTGDTEWTDDLPDFFKGVDLLLSEASLYSRYKGRISGHLTADEAGKLAVESGAGILVLTHLPHSGDHGELVFEAASVFKGPVELASRGRVWNI